MRSESAILWVSAMGMLMMAMVAQMIIPESTPVFVLGLGSMGATALLVIESILHLRSLERRQRDIRDAHERMRENVRK